MRGIRGRELVFAAALITVGTLAGCGAAESTPEGLPSGSVGPYTSGSRVDLCGDRVGISLGDEQRVTLGADEAGVVEPALRTGDRLDVTSTCAIEVVGFGTRTTNAGPASVVWLRVIADD